MKKFLLSMGLLFSLVIVGKSQTVLNEIYTDPGSGKSEFFELYNNSTIPGGQSVDCFTILTYWKSGSNDGWYVMDLPNLIVGPKGFFTGAAASPFSVQNSTGVVPNFNWNATNFRDGSTGGSLKKFQRNGSGYTDVTASIPANFNDFLFGGNGNDYIVLVFVNGVLNNGFIGGVSTGVLPSYVTSFGALPVDMNGACSDFNIDFATLSPVEFVISQPGADNGYARTSDGKCGAWAKTAPGTSHTPNVTNGSASGLTGSLVTSPEILKCNVGPGISRVIYSITGVSGSASEAADFPVEIQLYYDFGTLGQLDGADTYQSSKFDNLISDDVDSFTIAQTQPVILVYKTKRGCFDKVVSIANGCAPLPVKMSVFNAARNHSNVLLKWETVFEENSAGFAIERNINGTWQEIAYVPSQAPLGFSNELLRYEYNDLNNVKGITQYRIRQVDLNTKSSYSAIRAVRGEGQIGNTVVFPNPTSNGKVTVVFEDATTARDVTLVDLAGRIIKQWRNAVNNIQIDNLTPGMYSLKIMIPQTGEQSVEKIVVTKQ